MVPNTGYPIEWIQTVCAAVAVLMTLWMMFDCYKDALGVPKYELARRTLGARSVIGEFNKFMAKLGFLVVGISSVLLPPPYYGSTGLTLQEIEAAEKLAITISRGGIIWGIMWLMIDSIASRALRHQFLRRMKWNGEETPAPEVMDPKMLRKDAATTANPIPRANEIGRPTHPPLPWWTRLARALRLSSKS